MPSEGKTNTKSILTIAYPEVEKQLSDSNIIAKYRKFMMELLSKRQTQLYANAPTKQMYYTAEDVNTWFRVLGIDRDKIKQGIKGTYYYRQANFNPSYAKDDSTIALLCMVRYFILHKKESELNLALLNLCLSGKYYPSIFYKSFRFEPQAHVMEYAVNTLLTNKYDIIRKGNIIGVLKNISSIWAETYSKDKFAKFYDNDITYLLQQLHNRIDSFIHNIALVYYEAYENKDAFMTYDSDDVSEDNYRLADNDAFKISRIVDNAIEEICTKGVDYVNCKRSSNNLVKFDELKAIIENMITDNKNIPLIKEFITILVALYFAQAKYKNVQDIAFISFSIRPTPNTKNQYAIRKKEIMDQLLINNSDQFQRRRSRNATESAYYRAFNAYMALMTKKANS